jgi:hypothetical protein
MNNKHNLQSGNIFLNTVIILLIVIIVAAVMFPIFANTRHCGEGRKSTC